MRFKYVSGDKHNDKIQNIEIMSAKKGKNEDF